MHTVYISCFGVLHRGGHVLKFKEDCNRFVCIKQSPDTQYFHRWHCFIAEEKDGLFAAQKQ